MHKSNLIKKSSHLPTVLIYGGSSYIGYHLVQSFLQKDARVVYLDSDIDKNDFKLSSFFSNPKFAFFKIENHNFLPKEIESVDYIIHIGQIENYFINNKDFDLESILINSQAIKNLLDLAGHSDAKFLLLSPLDTIRTDSLYLKNSSLLSYNINLNNEYDFVQLYKFSEAFLFEHFKKYGTDVRIVRLPYIYGPNISMYSSGSLGLMLNDLLENRDITIYGDENRSEYYIYVQDALSGIVKSLFTPDTKGKTINLIDDDFHKVLSIAYLLKNLSNTVTQVVIKAKEMSYKNFLVKKPVDIDNLNWNQKFSLKEGIISTLNYYGYKVSQNSFKPNDLVTEKLNNNDKKIHSSYNVLQKSQQDLPSFLKNKNDNSNVVVDSYSTTSIIFDENSLNDIEKDFYNNNFLKNDQTNLEYLNYNLKTNNNNFKAFSNVGETNKFVKKNNFNIVNLFSFKFNKDFLNFSKNFNNNSFLNSLSLFIILLLFLMVFIFYPLINFSFSLNSTYNSLQNAKSNIYNYNILQTQKSIQESKNALYSAKKQYASSKWLFSLLLGKNGYDSLNNFLLSADHFIKSSNYMSLAFEPFSNFMTVLHPDSVKFYDSDTIKKSQAYLFSANNEMKLASNSAKIVQSKALPFFLKDYFFNYQQALNVVSENLDLLALSFTDFESLVGMDGPKNYLLWFQNSNELRPTGGFIGSYGVLTIDKGKIVGIFVDDVYNPDGQIDLLDIKTPIPSILANSLAEDRMYLRNSNFDPDFSISAKNFSDLYTQITKDSINGVIAIDLFFVKSVLESIGPMYLATYNETISSDNLYERTQFYSDYNYKSGISDKKTFLNVLSSKMIETIFSLEESKLQPLYQAILKSLNQRNILLYFSNNSASILLDKKNWSGKLVSTQGDYLNIVNSNLGGTKANYFVKNSYDYKVNSMTRDGLLRSNLTLNYKHNGVDMSWPGGPYKNYIRVLKNTGTKLTGATILINNNNAEDIFSDVIINKVGDFDSFEYMLNLNPTESAVINLNFDLPLSLSFNKSFKDYNLYWQKQPGTMGDRITFNIKEPFGTEIREFQTNSAYEENDESINFVDFLDTDKYFKINIE